MSTGDGEHSFGHGQFCHWCGVDGDDPEIEQPCDERENKKPTDESMAVYEARIAVSEQIAQLAEIDYGITQSIEWDELMEKIQALRPTP